MVSTWKPYFLMETLFSNRNPIFQWKPYFPMEAQFSMWLKGGQNSQISHWTPGRKPYLCTSYKWTKRFHEFFPCRIELYDFLGFTCLCLGVVVGDCVAKHPCRSHRAPKSHNVQVHCWGYSRCGSDSCCRTRKCWHGEVERQASARRSMQVVPETRETGPLHTVEFCFGILYYVMISTQKLQ